MSDHVRPQSIRSRLLILSVVAIAGLTVSGLMYGTLLSREQRVVEARFQLDAEHLSAAIERDFATHLEVVGALKAFYGASENVTRDEFRIFNNYYLPPRPGILELAWVPRVLDEGRTDHVEKAVNESKLADYQIREFDAKGNVVTPAETRPEHFPVLYLERGTGESDHDSRLAFGLNVATHPRCWDAMQRARDSGLLRATGQIVRRQDNKGLSGYIVVVPIYEKGLPKDPSSQQRRDNLRGFVVGICSRFQGKAGQRVRGGGLSACQYGAHVSLDCGRADCPVGNCGRAGLYLSVCQRFHIGPG